MHRDGDYDNIRMGLLIISFCPEPSGGATEPAYFERARLQGMHACDT